ncbi:PQQ-binding-like beta-propeller repeat protein [Tomitella fengzijianii]|uniref:PQQ-binding-like beta-propeller repeat protein n=1 Tax=Tomitella fengzijianii TaxID=2597660 RepID=A0A516X533_9ACTN|nr:PQQ-binding-like beta-propeller repeat protein [Tomitella fengzijianii]QDQ98179.1 PQQ-binding-like beta-propeller repeat protein [Tomitella fengzijianii]
MPRPEPERRTRVDLAVTALISAAIIVAALIVWWTSPSRATDAEPAVGAAPVPTAVTGTPSALAEAWRAPDAAAGHPLVVGGTVITADGSTVLGHDFRTGEVRWSYERGVPLCAATAAFGHAVAVYRTGDGCSEVTAVDADSGRRGPQRSSNSDDTMRLLTGEDRVTAVGTTRIESWRSDLVRTVEYGRVDAPVHADSDPRPGCSIDSAAASGTRIAVLERCPGDAGVRLTVMTATPDDASQPDVLGSQVLGIDGAPLQAARVVAVSGEHTAVVAPDGQGTALLVYDASVARESLTPLADGTAIDRVVVGARSGPVITFWNGASTVALDARTLAVRWRMPGTLGPGTSMASALLVPTAEGLAVAGPWDGSVRRTIPVDRTADGAVGTAGPVVPGTAGNVVLEQRGGTLVALTPVPPPE